MKIYTKTGDSGETSLAIGGRVKKYDRRVDLYGNSDELNSVIGIAVSFLPEDSELRPVLGQIQNLLFELGSELAGYSKLDANGERVPIILPEDIRELETKMDAWTEILPPLKHFVLPGGGKPASFLHLARTVCRRLERKMVEGKDLGLDIPSDSLVFINRLSDTLFLASRMANLHSGVSEPIWISRAKSGR
jgi:cob(I)alamin adenosyltransferase